VPPQMVHRPSPLLSIVVAYGKKRSWEMESPTHVRLSPESALPARCRRIAATVAVTNQRTVGVNKE
jgi:hypothetical protein